MAISKEELLELRRKKTEENLEMQKQSGGEDTFMLDVSTLSESPYQPRDIYDEESMEELMNSIIERGVLVPILVREKDGAYEIVAGHRRKRACEELGIKSLPAKILQADDNEAMIIALVENIQRKDLSLLEEAKSLLKLQESGVFKTIEEIARKISKKRERVSQLIAIAKNISNELEGILKGKKIDSVVLYKIVQLEPKNQLLAYKKVSEMGRDEALELIETMSSPKQRKASLYLTYGAKKRGFYLKEERANAKKLSLSLDVEKIKELNDAEKQKLRELSEMILRELV